jgi:hypothetical protein
MTTKRPDLQKNTRVLQKLPNGRDRFFFLIDVIHPVGACPGWFDQQQSRMGCGLLTKGHHVHHRRKK